MSPCSFSIQLDPIDFHCMVKNSFNILQILLLLFFVAREKQSCRFETTCGWINDDRLFFLRWSIHYRPKNKQTNNLMFSFFIWDFPLICDVQLINDVSLNSLLINSNLVCTHTAVFRFWSWSCLYEHFWTMHNSHSLGKMCYIYNISRIN